MMKSWLVDVPVAINIWIRPELQRKQWEIIKKVRPSTLFIQSDGGRNEEEWEAIKQNRKYIDSGIDWSCNVYKLYMDSNNGLYTMIFKLRELVWSKVDRCIFLEDDQIPSRSFFRFCSELLIRYKDDQRIEAICGFNNINTWDVGASDYFFSSNGSIWGIATWSNRYNIQSIDIYKNNKYLLKSIKYLEDTDYNTASIIRGYVKDPFFNNHPPAEEFWHWFNCFAYHRLFIIPSKNMITCEGATDNSTHMCEYNKLPPYLKKIFNSKSYEISFPLRHPDFVFDDEDYARAVEMSLNRLKNSNNKVTKPNPGLRLILFLKRGHYFKRIFRYLKNKVAYKKKVIEK